MGIHFAQCVMEMSDAATSTRLVVFPQRHKNDTQSSVAHRSECSFLMALNKVDTKNPCILQTARYEARIAVFVAFHDSNNLEL